MAVQVGVRAFRERLSYWLDRAARGEEIVITERGAARAKLVDAGRETTLERLIAEGLVTPRSRSKRRIRMTDLVSARGSVTDLLLDERRQGR